MAWVDYSNSTALSWADYSDSTALAWTDDSSSTNLSWTDDSSPSVGTWLDYSDSDPLRWVPFAKLTDPAGGTDFVPKATNHSPYIATTDRPLRAISASTITAAGYAGEGLP